jgi:nucleoside 2-deoxyribosyltransferase
MGMLKAYLASPLGFTEPTRFWYNKVFVPAVKKAGITPIDPWILTADAEVQAVLSMPVGEKRDAAIHALHHEMAKRNKVGIDMADIIIACLDGQELDGGTCAEIGYGVKGGKVAYGWRTDWRMTGEQGAIVNLQVQYFIEASGGKIFRDLKELYAEASKFKKMYCGG